MSEVELWPAVIAQALTDATSTANTGTAPLERKQARAWFQKACFDFREACILADMEPSAVRTFALDRIAECVDPAPLPPKRKGQGSRPLRLDFEGFNLTIREWSDRTGIEPSTIHHRLSNGWTVERALTEQPRPKAAQ